MSKLSTAKCAECGERLNRHDKNRVMVAAPSHNLAGRKETFHTACYEKDIKIEVLE